MVKKLFGGAAMKNEIYRTFHLIVYRKSRLKSRNHNNIRWLKFFRWHFVNVSLDIILNSGTNPNATGLQDVFDNMDSGLQRMKDWCEYNCKKKWRYEPNGTFIFKSHNDAVLFKIFWS
jgi:hypothetical protein